MSAYKEAKQNSENAHDVHDGSSNSDYSYLELLRINRPFRLYLLSYLLGRCGDWFTYVACIRLIEELQGSVMSRTAISLLVVARLLPHVLCSFAGGVIADSRDRRISMITSDLSGAAIALLFLLAYYEKSVATVYIVTFVQEMNMALYESNRSSILRLMVTDPCGLQKSTTLVQIAWSLMAAVGAALGGFAVSLLGIRACFLLDSGTFLLGATFMWMVGGEWIAADESSHEYDTVWNQLYGMTLGGIQYLRKSFFGPLVLMKLSCSLIYGGCDVLYVSFSERGAGDSSVKLGILFSAVGVGCIVGPMVMERVIDMQRYSSLQLGAVACLIVSSVGLLGMGLFESFALTCFFTAFRAAGSSSLWVNLAILFQTFAANEKLGRVLAIDWALAVFGEASSALAAGILQDEYHLSAQQVSFVLAGLGGFLSIVWIIYHATGHGAARKDVATLIPAMRLSESGQFEDLDEEESASLTMKKTGGYDTMERIQS